VLEGTDQKEYYNKNVGGVRFYVPLETYEDPEYIKNRYHNPEYLKKRSAASKAQWADPNSAYNSPEYKKKKSVAMSKGPYRITFDTGREIIIDSLRGWAKSNGYSQGALSALLGGEPVFDRRRGKDYKYKRTKHKDIVKVERIGEHPSDMGE
jgi:hypothetical protein